MKIIKEVLLALETIQKAGYEAYIVGGAVRDLLLAIETNDYDLCTNAKPEVIKQLFKNYPQSYYGEKHGTIMVKINNYALEITTYRQEYNYLDFRHPEKIIYTDQLIIDLQRRDFTINALCLNQDGLLDLVDGEKDLANRLIRTINDPFQRFKEDPLRILRAIRFQGKLKFKLEKNTYQALLKCSPLLLNLSKERIQSEFFKILTCANFPDLYREYSLIFELILPCLKDLSLKQLNENLQYIAASPNSIIIRLALLTRKIEVNYNLQETLKLSNEQTWQVTFLKRYEQYPLHTKYNILKLLAVNEDLDFLFTYQEIINQQDLQQEKQLFHKLKENSCYKISQLNISGHDLIAYNIVGIKIKQTQQLLLEAVIKDEVENTTNSLLNYLKKRRIIPSS